MEDSDRSKILTNLVELMRVRNITEFHSELISRQIFSPDMLESILAERRNPKEQIQKLFIEICKRGPYAFRNLVEALGRSGNVREAQLLDRSYTGAGAGGPRPPQHHRRPQDHDENENAAEEEAVVYQQHQPRIPDEHDPVHRNLDDEEEVEAQDPVLNNSYRLNSNPKGYALIINVIDFDGNPGLKRYGAQSDSDRLGGLLQWLGYEVTTVINPKKKDLLCPNNGHLKRFTDKFSHRPVDSCIVSVMSHGEDNFWFQTSDCENIGNETANLIHTWEDFFPRFNNQHFPMMRSKPKLFIIQACRGDRHHKRIDVTPTTSIRRPNSITYDSAPRSTTNYYERHPEFNHMIILQSTIPGYVSVRHEIKGSPFIKTICDVFRNYGKKEPIMDLIPEIAKRLQELSPEEGGPQTITCKTVGYFKKFQFR